MNTSRTIRNIRCRGVQRILLFVIVSLCLSVQASLAQMQTSIEEIKSSPLYYCAEGVGTTIEQADADALQKLVGQISISVKVEGSLSISEDDGQVSSGESYSSSVKTLSISTLQNVGSKVLEMEPNARVLRYVLRSDVDSMFEEREKKIAGYIATAKRAEQRLQIDDALKYYYWALVLASMHPYTVDCTFGADTAGCLSMLPLKIKSIISDVKVTLDGVSSDDRLVTAMLKFTYDDHSVASLKFRYFDGQTIIGPVSLRDGECELELVQLPSDGKVPLYWEYRFSSDAMNIDLELRNIFEANSLPSVEVPTTYVKVELPETKQEAKERKREERLQNKASKNKASKGSVSSSSAASSSDIVSSALSSGSTVGELGIGGKNTGLSSITSTALDVAAVEIAPERIVERNMVELDNIEGEDALPYLSALTTVAQAINSHSAVLAKDCFSSEGYEFFEALLAQTPYISTVGDADYVFWNTDTRIIARDFDIKMKFSNARVFMEKLTFRFSKESGKIESLAFAMTQKAERDIFNAAAQWSEISRFHILNFMEDYQTAYALKRYDYLKSIFSDSAIIITGTVLSATQPSFEYKETAPINFSGADTNVSYTKLSKSEFLERLKGHFSSREYIHLTFEDNVTQLVNTGGILPDGAAFGIQISQTYSSPSYADKGYLSLLLNMQGKNPIIEVRLWEPNLGEYTALDKFISNFDF